MLRVISSSILQFLLISVIVTNIYGQQPWSSWSDPKENWTPWRPPWGDVYDTSVRVRTSFGDVIGFTVPWHIDDTIFIHEWQEYPPYATRRINCFLGVPYASPPTGELRFQRPRDPRWGGYWDASYYRPSCPQQIEEIQRDIPDFPKTNISEDCLYMNVFAPNYTQYNSLYKEYRDVLFPVLVWIHSGDFLTGSAQIHPGHVLATRDVVVVTFNYRLGALGFFSLQDEEATGNWGLFDQQKALEFVKQNIKAFRGDPDRITVAGDGSGAASVGFHLVSEMTRDKKFFHQCIMMSATDLSPDLFLNPYWQPRKYAKELASKLGCGTDDSYKLMHCMRDNDTVTWQKILQTQDQVRPRNGVMGIVWAPTQDGGWFTDPAYNRIDPQVPYLRYTPRDMRQMGKVDKIPCIIGLNTQDGAKKANETLRNIDNGMEPEQMTRFITTMLTEWGIQDLYKDRAIEAVEFQYTFWPEPWNKSARTQQLIDLFTDINVGSGMDEVIKGQAEHAPQWFYRFNFNSWNNWLPQWQGVSYSAAVPYVFGVPFMNETILNETKVMPRQWYDYEDRNMSDWMMYMWTNFIKEGHPTPNITRNVTWEPYTFNNLSYLIMDYHSYIWFRYRQEKYSFWSEYFPQIAKQDFFFVTPTPAGYNYVIATGAMSSVVLVLICLAGFLGFLIWYQSESQREKELYHSSDLPMGFMAASRTASQATLQSQQSRASAYLSEPSRATGYRSDYSQGTGFQSQRSRGTVNPAMEKSTESLSESRSPASSYPYLQRTLQLNNPYAARPSTSSSRHHHSQHSVV